ncbi:MAG TPA: hypothetical protein VNR89_17515 [Roseomonas sp.]|nr:hypothetical protein [Roseomonas sp.]
MTIDVNAASDALIKAVRQLPPTQTCVTAHEPVAICATLDDDLRISVVTRAGRMPCGAPCSRYIKPSTKAGQRLIGRLRVGDAQCAERVMLEAIERGRLIYDGQLVRSIPLSKCEKILALYNFLTGNHEEDANALQSPSRFAAALAVHIARARCAVMSIHSMQQTLDDTRSRLDELEGILLDDIVRLGELKEQIS